MLKDSDYVERCRFSVLHKIVLGLIVKDLKSVLVTSTAGISQGDARGRTSLCWATIRDDQLAAQTLLALGADLSVTDNLKQSPLHFVQCASTCKPLLDGVVDVNARIADHDRTALHQLCHGIGKVEIVD